MRHHRLTIEAGLFIAIMCATMPAYLIIPADWPRAGQRMITMLPAVAMATYLTFVAFRWGVEANAQSFVLVGIVAATIAGIVAALAGETSAWRAMTFSLHVTALVLIVGWRCRTFISAALAATILMTAGVVLQCYNVLEFGLCNYGAPEPSAAPGHTSVCVRRVGDPLVLMIPLFVVLSVGQWAAARVVARCGR